MRARFAPDLEIGQDAIVVGVVGARDPGDVVFSTSGDVVFSTCCGHGWALACGLPALSLLADVAGRVGGPSAGRGGSAYFSDPDHGFYGENSIVGGSVAITVFGDGATNQGTVHESKNMAAAMRLPVIFVCECNGTSELTRIDGMVGDPVMSRRAAGYGTSGVRIDGSDLTGR